MLTVMRFLSREEVAVFFFTEANILSMLASELYSGKVTDWNFWRHLQFWLAVTNFSHYV
jgi:hypothetical protein